MAIAARRARDSATWRISPASGCPPGRPRVSTPISRPRAVSGMPRTGPASAGSVDSRTPASSTRSSASRSGPTSRSSSCQTCWRTGWSRSSCRWIAHQVASWGTTICPVIAIVIRWSSDPASRTPASSSRPSQRRRSTSAVRSRARSIGPASDTATRWSSATWAPSKPPGCSEAAPSVPTTRPSTTAGTTTSERSLVPASSGTAPSARSVSTSGRSGLVGFRAPGSFRSMRVPRRTASSPLTAVTSRSASKSWTESR